MHILRSNFVLDPREHVLKRLVTDFLPDLDTLGVAVIEELVAGFIITLHLSPVLAQIEHPASLQIFFKS